MLIYDYFDSLSVFSIKEVRMALSHALVVYNLPLNDTLNGVNLKKVLSQSKFIYLLPSRDLTLKDMSTQIQEALNSMKCFKNQCLI